MFRKIGEVVYCAFIPVVCTESDAQNVTKTLPDVNVFDRLKEALSPT